MTGQRPGPNVVAAETDGVERSLRTVLEDRGRTSHGDVQALLEAVEHLPPRRAGSRQRSLVTAAAAVIVLVIAGGLLTGRVATPAPGGVPADDLSPSPSQRSATPESAASPTGTPLPATLEPGPGWAASAESNLECDGPPSAIGPSGPMELGRDESEPRRVVNDFLQFVKDSAILFPVDGFSESRSATRAALYVLDVSGRAKAAIVLVGAEGAGTTFWTISDVASCDPSELPSGAVPGLRTWTDSSGRPVSTTTLLEKDDCYGARTLTVAGRLYVRDPRGEAVDRGQLDATYDGDTTPPDTAIEQPYRDGKRTLFLAKNGTAAYVATAERVERWPHVKGDEIVRTDCN